MRVILNDMLPEQARQIRMVAGGGDGNANKGSVRKPMQCVQPWCRCRNRKFQKKLESAQPVRKDGNGVARGIDRSQAKSGQEAMEAKTLPWRKCRPERRGRSKAR